MKLDRELQLRLLRALADAYPESVFNIEEAASMPRGAVRVIANLAYLAEHELIYCKFMSAGGKGMSLRGSPRITAKGLDFLAQDGGLGAILGTVTIRLHEETLRAVIERGVLQSSLPQAEKTGVLQTLRALPADSIKHLTMKLMDLGLENSPKAIPLIQSLLFPQG
ncbi:MAG: hypothetical protein JKY26_06585 [Pseudomonas sp.]|nr:hypothetical protein [Pseudomonas sp.]